MTNISLIWAKTGKSADSTYHPLILHAIDSYNVAEQILELIPSRFANELGLDRRVLKVVTGLHDIGKCTQSFQKKNTNLYKRLIQENPELGEVTCSEMRHERASAMILYYWLAEKGIEKPYNHPFFENAKYILLHHTKFISFPPRDIAQNKHGIYGGCLGNQAWKELQLEIIEEFLNVTCGSDRDFIFKAEKPNPSQLAYLSGFITLCDWIASGYFTPQSEYESLAGYHETSSETARKALTAYKFDVTDKIITADFEELFPHIKAKRKLQEISSKIELSETPNLLIIEAPTGEGKTEAALNIAARLNCNKKSGIYVAMPTQATSNGLKDRYEDFIKNAERAQAHNIQLIHGGKLLHNLQAEVNEANYASVNEHGDHQNNNKEEKYDWFRQNKRAFLAPYGIGTIDQAFYSVLLVKHFFLRLYSLAGKAVIFDEVHAYDYYMSELLVHLLKWLKALKSNVIILSATLPVRMKNKLLKAWTGEELPIQSVYPQLNVINDEFVKTETFSPRFHEENKDERFEIDFIDDSIDTISNEALQHYRGGAKVLVILNKVARSQKVFQQISDAIDDKNSRLLIHARFHYARRQELEKNVFAKFGKDANRAGAEILVSTQIVEQSLDIDFDIIISDIAPIDLLIQRAGRMHRHEKSRPAGYEVPRLIVACSEAEGNNLPNVSEHKYIYQALILWRTYFASQKSRTKWNFHRDFREPVEAVYYSFKDEDEPLLKMDLSEEEREIVLEQLRDARNLEQLANNAANQVLIPLPENFNQIIEYNNMELKDEDSYTGSGAIAKTRLGTLSSKVILLFEAEGIIYHDSECENEAITEPRTLNDIQLLSYLEGSLSISNKSVIRHILDMPKWWDELLEKNKLLKNYLPLIIPKVGLEIADTLIVEYDNELGLIYNREQDANI